MLGATSAGLSGLFTAVSDLENSGTPERDTGIGTRSIVLFIMPLDETSTADSVFNSSSRFFSADIVAFFIETLCMILLIAAFDSRLSIISDDLSLTIFKEVTKESNFCEGMDCSEDISVFAILLMLLKTDMAEFGSLKIIFAADSGAFFGSASIAMTLAPVLAAESLLTIVFISDIAESMDLDTDSTI